jgi:dihydrofolate synthase/folylpolyglutamate synthase
MVMGEKPFIVFDSAHNEGGIRELIYEIRNTKYETLHFVFGTVADKDISKVLSLLPQDAKYYFCKADIPRGLNAEELKQEASKFKLKGEVYASVNKAFKAAKQNASKKDLVLVAGSVFIVAELI